MTAPSRRPLRPVPWPVWSVLVAGWTLAATVAVAEQVASARERPGKPRAAP